MVRKLLLDPIKKISSHVDFLFGQGVSSVLPDNLDMEYSRKTGKIKNFRSDGKLIGTFRTDGGIAITIEGAKLFLRHPNFLYGNCIIPVDDAIPFVMEGRSLFSKHVYRCGSNIRCDSDVAVIDNNNNVLAVGRSLFPYSYYLDHDSDKTLLKGVGVKIREGIKSRSV
jgi:uncharacterized protein with predicted RNA binding PUA domain